MCCNITIQNKHISAHHPLSHFLALKLLKALQGNIPTDKLNFLELIKKVPITLQIVSFNVVKMFNKVPTEVLHIL